MNATRKKVMLLPAVAVLVPLSCTVVAEDQSHAVVRWEPTFADEFDAPAGAPIDAARWVHDIGGGGWGNAELQTYTDRPENLYHDGDGHLIIQANLETFTGPDDVERPYTSARIKTQGQFSQTYGRVEARLKLPQGQGLWPAFWLLGENITDVGWPRCGEIDIMENIGSEPTKAHGTVHGPGYSGMAGIAGTLKLEDGRAYADDFHVFAVEWEPRQIRWYIDGQPFHSVAPDDLGASQWVFDTPHFVILNLAVGGHWPGNPDASTRFPQQMVVDYVRVFHNPDLVVDQAQLDQEQRARIARNKQIERDNTYIHVGRVSLPGVVECEHFNPGGQGVGYHDLDPGNTGGAYRPNEDVDLGGAHNTQEGISVGWAEAAEWLAYDIDVTRPGPYRVEIRVACDGVGGLFHLEVDGHDVTGPIRVPDTGGWNTWRTITTEPVSLPTGEQTLRLVLDEHGQDVTAVGNFNHVRFEAQSQIDAGE